MLLEVPDNQRHLIPAELLADAPDHGSLAGREEPAVEAKPYNFNGVEIRVIDTDPDGIKFIAQDVCKALGLTNPSSVLNRLDDDEKGYKKIYTLGGPQTLLCLTQPGAFRVVGTCHKSRVEAFQRWMYHDVLMSVQQTGSYSVDAGARAMDERIRKLEGAMSQKLLNQKDLLDEKDELLAKKDETLENQEQAFDVLNQKRESDKLIAASQEAANLAQLTRADIVSGRQRRKGRRSLRPEDGWYTRSDLCDMLYLAPGYEKHYRRKNVSTTVLGVVMRLWGWTTWDPKSCLWIFYLPPACPLMPETHYRWVPEANKEYDPGSTSQHYQLYLRGAGVEIIRERWNRGLDDGSLADNLQDAVKGNYPRPPGPLLPGGAPKAVEVCTICGVSKLVGEYKKHYDVCLEQYLRALPLAAELVALGKDIEVAAWHGAIKAGVPDEGGRYEVVKKLVAQLRKGA